jgi:hypothetical protein
VGRIVIAVVVLALLAGGALLVARSAGLGPFAAASASRVYVAISRSDDETDAREIEVIDVATGERDLFTVTGHITALAVARDHRTLFVGTSDGRVLLLDPSRGSLFRTLAVRGPVFHLLPLDDPARLAVVTSAGLALWDVIATRELGTLAIDGTPVGRPALRASEVLVPVSDAQAQMNALVVATLEPLSASRWGVTRIVGRMPSGVPQVIVNVEGQPVFLAQFDPAIGGARLQIGALDQPRPRELVLAASTSSDGRPLRGLLQVQSSLGLGRDGVVHACIGNADVATRYRLARGAEAPERVGSECGQFVVAADGTAYLAVRGKPQLAVLSSETGKVVRGLPLPGIAVLAAS